MANAWNRSRSMSHTLAGSGVARCPVASGIETLGDAPSASGKIACEIRTWRDLMAAAATGRAYLGISPSAYQEACEVMGEDQAAIVIAAIDDHGVAAGKTREEEAGVVSLMHGLRLTDAVIFGRAPPGFPGLGHLAACADERRARLDDGLCHSGATRAGPV